jgi:uncharacterized membrane protein
LVSDRLVHASDVRIQRVDGLVLQLGRHLLRPVRFFLYSDCLFILTVVEYEHKHLGIEDAQQSAYARTGANEAQAGRAREEIERGGFIIKYWILAANIIMTVAGSTFLKLGSRTVVFEGSMVSIVLGYLTSPVILAGFLTYGLAAFLWVYCLSQFELSYVTFVTSLQYVLLLLVSILVFKEQISLMQWAGSAFIMIGVIFWMKG